MVRDDVGWVVDVSQEGKLFEMGDGSLTCHMVKLNGAIIYRTSSLEDQGFFVGRLVAAIRRDMCKENEHAG